MEGYEVRTLDDVIDSADVVITATGNRDIVTVEQMQRMKHLSVVGNIGHFDNEIDMAGLAAVPGIERIRSSRRSTSGSSPTGTRSSSSRRGGCSTSATRRGTRAS